MHSPRSYRDARCSHSSLLIDPSMPVRHRSAGEAHCRVLLRLTMVAYQIGIRCPHHSCRLTRPVALFAEPVEIALGVALREDLHAPSVTASIADLRESGPSSRTTDRPGTARSASCCGRECGQIDLAVFDLVRAGPALPGRPPLRSRGLSASSAVDTARHSSLSVPSGLRMLIHRQDCRCQTS